MKKEFILSFVVLLIAGLTILPAQDMVKLEQLGKEAEQLQSDAEAGRITGERFYQRMKEIEQEMIQAMGPYGGMVQPAQPYNPQQQQQAEQRYNQLQQQQPQEQQQTPQQRQPQNNWPDRTVLNKFGIGAVTQPSGTLASFNERTSGRDSLQIILKNATENHSKSVIDQLQTIPGIRGRGGLPIDRNSTDSKTWGRFRLNHWMIDVDLSIDIDSGGNSKQITITVSDPGYSPDKG